MLIFLICHISNNLFAETLLRTLGKELSGSASYDASRSAINSVLKKMGLDINMGLHIDDGIGLTGADGIDGIAVGLVKGLVIPVAQLVDTQAQVDLGIGLQSEGLQQGVAVAIDGDGLFLG